MELQERVVAPETTITEYMKRDHNACDSLYEEGETQLLEGQITEGERLIRAYINHIHQHFKMEEQYLFPAFEETTGTTEGPTTIMRTEHNQIRSVLEQLSECLDNQDYDTIPAIGETLLILIQQHNSKEENMLYPMSDYHLEHQQKSLIEEMQSLKNKNKDGPSSD